MNFHRPMEGDGKLRVQSALPWQRIPLQAQCHLHVTNTRHQSTTKGLPLFNKRKRRTENGRCAENDRVAENDVNLMIHARLPCVPSTAIKLHHVMHNRDMQHCHGMPFNFDKATRKYLSVKAAEGTLGVLGKCCL